MQVLTPRYTKEEFAKLGDQIYESSVRPNTTSHDEGKSVAIDIESGDYEIDFDEMVAQDRLLARHPNAQIWLTKVGSRYARRSRLSAS